MTASDSEPKYVISIAARIVGIESHTLRYYEKLGLVQPYRSEGNIRYYSERDIEQLKHVKTLITDLGVNPAGVEVVVRMAQKLAELQNQVEKLESENSELRQQVENTTSATHKK
jgi:MerR family transcriptional regulator/heat shock protein HspR